MKPICIQDALFKAGIGAGQPAPRQYKPVRYDLAFITSGLHPSVDAAHKAVQWWINDITHGASDRRRWLTLFGKSGCGKSHLLTAAKAYTAAELPRRSVQLWNWGRLMERLLDGQHPGLFHQVATLKVLMLDDLGCELVASEKAQSVAMRQLYELLEARRGMWTLMASNLAPNDFPDVRIASRLFRHGNEVVDLSKAGDYAFECYKRNHASSNDA